MSSGVRLISRRYTVPESSTANSSRVAGPSGTGRKASGPSFARTRRSSQGSPGRSITCNPASRARLTAWSMSTGEWDASWRISSSVIQPRWRSTSRAWRWAKRREVRPRSLVSAITLLLGFGHVRQPVERPLLSDACLVRSRRSSWEPCVKRQDAPWRVGR